MTETESRVLQFLSLRGNRPIDHQSIAEKLQISRSRLTRVITELKTAGYIESEATWWDAEGEEVTANYRSFIGTGPSRGGNRYRILRSGIMSTLRSCFSCLTFLS